MQFEAAFANVSTYNYGHGLCQQRKSKTVMTRLTWFFHVDMVIESHEVVQTHVPNCWCTNLHNKRIVGL